MFLTFPNFNLYSTPLLVLVLQGMLFGLLLLFRFRKKGPLSDLFLALLVIITCYHRTTYTIGFMDWYDTYRNTKINYWLIYLGLAVGPLIYLYVRSITTSSFTFRKRDYLHFLPVLVYVLYRIGIFLYDSAQPGFDDTQNGVLMVAWEFGFLGTFSEFFFVAQHLLYLAFTFQLFYRYRASIRQYFSNTYRLEMNWIRNFLFLYAFLFVYSVMQQFINLSVVELSWIQKWWYQFFSALVVIYVGIKGYFTDTTVLKGLSFTPSITTSILPQNLEKPKNNLSKPDYQPKKEILSRYMVDNKPYLNPDLNLKELAMAIGMNRAELSDLINNAFQKNFNDYINEYRVEAVKTMLANNRHQHLSLLGIAYESGFNSKATFNRVFKKITQTSPTEYLRTQNS